MNHEQVETIRKKAIDLELEGIENIRSMPLEDLMQAYNGTGPEWFPAAWREKLDEKLRVFLPAVMVHDCDFDRSDGSVPSFDAANGRLLLNAIRCANDAATWLTLRRYALWLEAFALYRICSRTGRNAWRQAFLRNKEKASLQ